MLSINFWMKSRLNIWSIYQFASTPRLPGSKRSYQYAKAIADMGNDVTLWTSSFGHWSKVDSIKDGSPYKSESAGSLKVMCLKTKPLYYKNDMKRIVNMLDFARVFSKNAKKQHEKPDAIIASYPSPFAAFSAYRLAMKYNARFILEIRDLWPHNWVARGAFSKYHPLVQFLYCLEKYLYSRAEIIVTALPYVNEYLIERGILRDKVFWIPNAVDLSDNGHSSNGYKNDGSDRILQSLADNTEKGILNVVYVGGLGPANRVDSILGAAKRLKDQGEKGIFFTIIGSGHSKNALEDFVSDNSLDTVKIWPAVSGSSVPEILRHGDFGVLCLHDNPIYKYGVNLHKIYDYMSAGLPIVFAAHVRNNLVDLADAGITVSPGSSDEIARALEKFKSMNAQERSEIGKRGYRYITKNYDLKVLSKKYFDIISQN
jgi:glycosyltransferase involved in cell wall biosynthesis